MARWYQTMNTRILIAGCLFLIVAVLPTGALGGVLDAARQNSPICADLKEDNPGTGGDKFTECNAHPTSGALVNFICLAPSANAITVTVNDHYDATVATAKGKLDCPDYNVATCHPTPVTCEAAGTYTGGGGSGNCEGGTEEAFDSGMAWACASVGGPCDGSLIERCPTADELIQKAKDAADQAQKDFCDRVGCPSPTGGIDLDGVFTQVFNAFNNLESLALGYVDELGNTIGIVCNRIACEEIISLPCNLSDGFLTCMVGDPRDSS